MAKAIATGNAVDVDYNRMISGSPGDDASNKGSAFVYYKTGTNTWNYSQKLVAPDRENYDRFGSDVALSSNFAIVGAPDEDTDGTDAGAAYIFQNVGGTWSHMATLRPGAANGADAGDKFGTSVAISSKYAIIGAPWDEAAGYIKSGSVYVYERISGVWTLVQKLFAANPAAYDNYGYSVDIEGFGYRMVVGAPGYLPSLGGVGPGKVEVLRRTGSPFALEQEINAATGLSYFDRFGHAVYTDGGYTLIGSPGDDPGGTNAGGSGYIFRRTGTTWTEQAYLSSPTPDEGGNFGWAVAKSNCGAMFGAIGDDENVANSGAVCVFEENNGVWSFSEKLKQNGTGISGG
ncbi:MAG: hypothetical protein AAF570_28275, partial [Bacteroidota bacterium]